MNDPLVHPIGQPGQRLPSGTVTFLFTDIEGSTQLWEKHPNEMKSALARHDSILRRAVESHHGIVIKTTGDGFHAVFEKAIDAMNEVLPPMRSFVLPGGHPTVSYTHIARCVCRRAERNVTALAETAPVDEKVVKYLNRLSDGESGARSPGRPGPARPRPRQRRPSSRASAAAGGARRA